MDIGCRFFTPIYISEDIAQVAGSPELIVDLFAGGGNLHKAFLRKEYAVKALALDINQDILDSYCFDDQVEVKFANCLNIRSIEAVLTEFANTEMTFVLNPPFKRITAKQEQAYWSQFDNYCPEHLTQRIECVAIASAIQAAPCGSCFYVIVPQLVLQSKKTAPFFAALKKSYSLKVVKEYNKALFSSAEVDVAVISLSKGKNKNLPEILNHHFRKHETFAIKERAEPYVHDSFHISRGLVRAPEDRRWQISAKHLKVGGVEIEGPLTYSDYYSRGISNCSMSGDILIARVGRRMLGRVGVLTSKSALTNESIFSLRVKDATEREVVYNAIKSEEFANWCKKHARGTANYFLTKKDVAQWVSKTIINTKYYGKADTQEGRKASQGAR
jgi:hypothetical protein